MISQAVEAVLKMFLDLNAFFIKIIRSDLLISTPIIVNLTCYSLCFFTEPHPPTNLSAVVQCNQGYEIQIDWQVRYKNTFA